MNKNIFGGRGVMWAFRARFSEEKFKCKYSDKIYLGTYKLVKCKLKHEIQFGWNWVFENGIRQRTARIRNKVGAI